MKRILAFVFVIIGTAVTLPHASALSEALREPSIFFPKGYDTNRAQKIVAVLRVTNDLQYLGGLTSYWEPKFSTTLVYAGSPNSLRSLIRALDGIDSVRVHVTYSDNLSKETGSALQAGSWWVVYSHTLPNTIEIRVNRAAQGFQTASFEATPRR